MISVSSVLLLCVLPLLAEDREFEDRPGGLQLALLHLAAGGRRIIITIIIIMIIRRRKTIIVTITMTILIMIIVR